MIKLNRQMNSQLRSELRKFFRGTEIETNVARQAVSQMIKAGETNVNTLVPFIWELVDEMISHVTLNDLERNGEDTKINIHTVRQATRTYLLNFAMRSLRNRVRTA